MYIPVTTDIRYKAKACIESFGGRSSKGTEALASDHLSPNLSGLM